MEDIILVGYGGHAKSVSDCIERQKEYRITGYTDISERDSSYEYLGADGVLEVCFGKGIRNAAVGVGYLGKGRIREELYGYLKRIGYSLPVIRDPSAVIASSAEIGEGTFIGKGVVVNAEAKIGKMAIINTGAVIEHDCRISDFVHVACGAVLCGQVKVGKAAFVGANATMIQGMEMRERGIVPAGAVVRKRRENGYGKSQDYSRSRGQS